MSAGAFFARAFEKQCRDAIEQKLAATSAFKKSLAGIATVQDAQAKGYAPSDAQIAAIASCIQNVADSAYGLPAFCSQPATVAAGQLADAVGTMLSQLNNQWREGRQFAFDAKDLADMLNEARGMVAKAHTQFAPTAF